jgi:hypothetical protein
VSGERGRRRIRWLRISLDVLAVLLVGGYFLADASMHRVDAVAEHDRRPTDGPGQDWLLVDAERPGIGRGSGRINALRLLHLPHRGGRPILINMPRDAYRWEPGYDSRMFEAAFERGGPKLLVASVEGAIGVRIDRYLEFRSATQALAPAGATDPAVLLNPFRGIPLLAHIGRSITIDKADRLHHLIELAFALHKVGGGAAVKLNLPISGSTTLAGVGPVRLIDDAKIRALATAIAGDRPVPASLLSG